MAKQPFVNLAAVVKRRGDDQVAENLFPLHRGSNLIGRLSTCSICLRDWTVSRRHAELILDRKTLVVRDLNSRNGTSVNGKVIQETQLAAEDLVEIGTFKFRVWDKCIGLLLIEDVERSTLEAGKVRGKVRGVSWDLRPAEQRVLSLLLDGLAEKEIAVRLSPSPHTIHNHVKAIYKTLQVTSRAELLSGILGETSQPFLVRSWRADRSQSPHMRL